MEVTEEALAALFAVLGPQLDERQRRAGTGASATGDAGSDPATEAGAAVRV